MPFTVRHIVAIQDTSSLRTDGDKYSIQAHPTKAIRVNSEPEIAPFLGEFRPFHFNNNPKCSIATDAESGALLGLIHADILRREGGKRGRRKDRAFEDKESRRWLDGVRASARLLDHGALHVTVVGDRESDIYEVFAHKPAPVDLVVRASHNRKLPDGARLFDLARDLPEAGQFDIDLVATPGRAARRARMVVRYCPVDVPKLKEEKIAPHF